MANSFSNGVDFMNFRDIKNIENIFLNVYNTRKLRLWFDNSLCTVLNRAIRKNSKENVFSNNFCLLLIKFE